MVPEGVQLRNLDSRRATVLASLCELIVPGSSRVAPVVYIDALLGHMSAAQKEGVLGSIDALETAAEEGAAGLRPVAPTPAFQLVRALAVEAFYSDFVAPGAPGPGAYEEIDFNSPLATRISKDWSYLGVAG
jgi:hypothetical protein